MSKLVMVDDGQPKTTTLQIAQGLELKHKTVFQLVNSYLPDFMELGDVVFKKTNSAFEMRNSTQGRWTRYAHIHSETGGGIGLVLGLPRHTYPLVYFQNNLPYGLRLEHGHSQQAPTGVYLNAFNSAVASL